MFKIKHSNTQADHYLQWSSKHVATSLQRGEEKDTIQPCCINVPVKSAKDYMFQ